VQQVPAFTPQASTCLCHAQLALQRPAQAWQLRLQQEQQLLLALQQAAA
jgi:hypothetical protein